MRTFVEERNYWLEALGDKVHVMGSITDSHDIPRWLAEGNDDMSRYRYGSDHNRLAAHAFIIDRVY